MGFRLIIKKQGIDFSEVALEVGQEYSIGRSRECNIQLDAEKGISRLHARVYHDGQGWVVENQSRRGSVFSARSSIEVLELSDQTSFSIPPFEFLMVKDQPKAQPKSTETSDFEENVEPTNPQMSVSFSEATQVGISHIVPYLKIMGAKNGNGILKLDGDTWVAGRDSKTQIHIDDGHVSRRHFELSRTSEGFFITDLGSANGTVVNDEEIPAHEPIQVLSGDRIQIMDVTIDFEIRDESFEKKVEAAKAQLAPYQPNLHPAAMIPHNPQAPGAIPMEDEYKPGLIKLHPSLLKNVDFKRNKIRILIALLLPVLFFGLFGQDKPPPKKGIADSASKSIRYDSLSQEQKAAVKDTFTLAQQHYKTLKYELCLAELQKLHEIIPSYENSKQLETFCQQGSILLQKEKDREARERKKRETELKIGTVVEDCRHKLGKVASEDKAMECMAEAVELDPEHALIVDFLNEIRIRQQERIDEKREAQRRRQRLLAGKRQYQKAKQLAKGDKLSQAISEYVKFINGGYPALSAEKKRARRELATVRSVLGKKIEGLLGTCEELRKKGEFKKAWMACNEATKEDPNHAKARELKQAALSDLRREMKSIYQDSILEESLGNVDAAKEKWKLIMERDLESDEYYNKARRKLKKYGIGI